MKNRSNSDKPQSNVPARHQIRVGQRVWAVEKRNYASGQLTDGIIQRILTSKSFHPRGIKVMFQDGTVARVQSLTAPETEPSIQPQAQIEFDEEFDLR